MKRNTAAFTLIEVALALLAIALGLLAFLGLGRLGLNAHKESLNDQRCDMLANAIFETLRERNLYFTELARTNELGHTWWDYWNQVRDNHAEQRVGFPVVANISLPEDHPNIIFNQVAITYDINRLSLANWNPRYGITINPFRGDVDVGKINTLHISLTIFPDGDTLSSEMRNYTTTLLRTGGLP